jgi:hypothetical protein
MGLLRRGVDAVKWLLRKVLKRVPGMRRLNAYRLAFLRANEQQDQMLARQEQLRSQLEHLRAHQEQLGTGQAQLLEFHLSTLHTLSELLERQRRQEQSLPETLRQLEQQVLEGHRRQDQALASLNMQIQRFFVRIQERLDELKRTQWREALGRRAA